MRVTIKWAVSLFLFFLGMLSVAAEFSAFLGGGTLPSFAILSSAVSLSAMSVIVFQYFDLLASRKLRGFGGLFLLWVAALFAGASVDELLEGEPAIAAVQFVFALIGLALSWRCLTPVLGARHRRNPPGMSRGRLLLAVVLGSTGVCALLVGLSMRGSLTLPVSVIALSLSLGLATVALIEWHRVGLSSRRRQVGASLALLGIVVAGLAMDNLLADRVFAAIGFVVTAGILAAGSRRLLSAPARARRD